MSYLDSLRARPGRPARRLASVALAVVACALQAWVFSHPQPLVATGAASTPATVAGAAAQGGGQQWGVRGVAGGAQPGPTLTVPPPPGVAIPEGAVLLYQTGASPAAAGSGAPSPGVASPGAQQSPWGAVQPGPTLTVPPPPGVAIPEGAVLLYESPGAAASPAGPVDGRPVYATDVLRGLVHLEKHGDLGLSQGQARKLLPLVRELGAAGKDMRKVRGEIEAVLTEEQLRWLADHGPKAGEIPEGAPEQTAPALARKAADALR